LNMKLHAMVDKFKGILTDFIKSSPESDIDAESNIVVALYFVSYFHPKNTSCREFLRTALQPADKGIELLRFLRAWAADESERKSKVREPDRFMTSDFEQYLAEFGKVEEQAMVNPKRF